MDWTEPLPRRSAMGVDTPCHCRPVAAAPSTEKRSALSELRDGVSRCPAG